MSSDELELWKRKRLLEMQRRALIKSIEDSKPKQIIEKEKDPERVLRRLFEGRAGEVYDAAKMQFPETTGKLTKVLSQLISKGELTGPVSGEELFWLFRRLGATVRLETHIKFVESGRTKTIGDKIKGE